MGVSDAMVRKGVAPGMTCHDRCLTMNAMFLTKYCSGVDPRLLAEITVMAELNQNLLLLLTKPCWTLPARKPRNPELVLV